MNVMKYLKFCAWALALPMLFVACDDDDNPGNGGEETEFRAERGIYVFNNGNEGYGINGSLTFIDLEAGYMNNVFVQQNGRELGSTVQDGVVLGENLYIAVSGSNTVEVVDKHTALSVAEQIRPTTEQGKGPRDIVTDGEYVYVSMQSGHVSRIDPSTNQIDNTVQVGPNPEEMAVLGDYLYVTNSDGLNYANGYVNGCSVSKIRLSDFTEEKKITVGMNPTKIVGHAASGKLFVACMGDYMANPASLWTIDTATDTATDLGVPVTLMCLSGNTLYTIYNDWSGGENLPYIAYDALTNNVVDEEFIPSVASPHNTELTYNRVDNPAGIVVNPDDGHIFVTSYVDDPANAYALPSYVYEYDTDGMVQRSFDVGVGAVNMLVLD